MSNVILIPLDDFAEIDCADCGRKELRVNLQPCPDCIVTLGDICGSCTGHHLDIHARDKRIKRLEEINALLANRIDALEAELKRIHKAA